MLDKKKVLACCSILSLFALTAFAAEGNICSKENDCSNSKVVCKEKGCVTSKTVCRAKAKCTKVEKKCVSDLPRMTLTDEQKEKLCKMSFEEKKEYLKTLREEYVKNLTPEQKEKLEKFEAMRKQRMEEHKAKIEAKMNALSKEQQNEVKKYLKDADEYRKKMADRLKKMSPEQVDVIRSMHGFYR